MRSRATHRLGQTRREPKKANPRFRLSGDGVLEGETKNVLKNEFGAEGDDCSGGQIEVVYTGMLSLALRPKQFLRWLMGPVY